jgi:VanZ family protein
MADKRISNRVKIKVANKNNLKPWIKVIAWMAVIFVVSSIPKSSIPKVKIFEFDKIFHMAEFLILAVLLSRAIGASFSNISFMKTAILAIIVSAFYAVFDEWHQKFIPGRVPDIFDFIVDFIGASIGVLIYRMRG